MGEFIVYSNNDEVLEITTEGSINDENGAIIIAPYSLSPPKGNIIRYIPIPLPLVKDKNKKDLE